MLVTLLRCLRSNASQFTKDLKALRYEAFLRIITNKFLPNTNKFLGNTNKILRNPFPSFSVLRAPAPCKRGLGRLAPPACQCGQHVLPLSGGGGRGRADSHQIRCISPAGPADIESWGEGDDVGQPRAEHRKKKLTQLASVYRPF